MTIGLREMDTVALNPKNTPWQSLFISCLVNDQGDGFQFLEVRKPHPGWGVVAEQWVI
jgi:hypothetical protein